MGSLLIICTGISGSGKKECIKTIKEIAKKAGKELHEVHTGDKMYEKTKDLGYPIANGTILDASERQLDYLRGLVFEEIIRLKESSENIIINTHACFRWHKHLTKAFDYHYLSKLNPDLYITVTDTIYSIFGRLEQNQWRGRNSLAELLTWRDEEEFVTKTFARIQKKQHFLVARSEPPEMLYNLIFKPEMKRGYLSYPISAAEKEAIQQVQEIRDDLRKNLIIFDPLAIKDVEGLSLASAQKKRGKTTTTISFLDYDGSEKTTTIPIEELERASIYLKDQTISRDYALIDQSDFVAVNYYNPDLPSPGVQREIRYAKDTGKPVYLYYPQDTMSPFQEFDIAKHFQSVDNFVSFLKKL